MSEFQDLSIVRAVAELAEDRRALFDRVRRLEEMNVELQRQLEQQKVEAERWTATMKALEPRGEA